MRNFDNERGTQIHSSFTLILVSAGSAVMVLVLVIAGLIGYSLGKREGRRQGKKQMLATKAENDNKVEVSINAFNIKL